MHRLLRNTAQSATLLTALVLMRVFHGGSEGVVPPDRSVAMVEAIRAAGGDIEYTEYEGVGHNSWDLAYGDADAISWLLNQRSDG